MSVQSGVRPQAVLSIVVSVFLHAAVLGVFFIGWQPTPPPKEIKRPNFVQATLVKLEAQSKPEKPAPEKPNVVDLTKKREEQARLKKLEQEKKKQQALKKKQEEQKKREAEQKALAEKKRKEDEAKKKKAEAEAEQKRQEQLRQLQEREQMERELAAERAAMLEASYAQTAQSYIGAIQQRIENNWSRPPSARNNMQCELLIKLVPTGRVINVDVIKSSGDSHFDRSAVQAVKKAEQFPEIKNMPTEVFERYYRELTLVFKPQDLRQ